ncbi:hypothetical protein LOC68_02605 [Blastopirellula sp. JC732]|uniref:Uncharacterized protein n=1 Tax=Blastopirellula sediminis TaxID=2894196 RepID=A0A9X1MKP5_9BACT|nr:hypothetical protein [Blastopirellula sediminis]MCC9607933.1 hypothetical protein [Blastopirellula sediminis]MCC9627274.1 hypothetical protein [Blastopirellula sediminis]
MGFTVYYRTTKPVSNELSSQISSAADALCRQRQWLSCEPIRFFAKTDGHMKGGSKPNFSPHPDDVAAFEAIDRPDGTMLDALEVLCEISRRHAVDWEFSHDHDEGPIGFIISGECDENLLAQVEALDQLTTLISGVQTGPAVAPNIYVEDDLIDDLPEDVGGFASLAEVEAHVEASDDDDDDEEPAILKFPS